MRYENLQLTGLDLSKLELIKENVFWDGDRDHSRWMFRGAGKDPRAGNETLYFKIWNPTSIRRDNILTGIEIGFYDELTTPALVGPIFHKGICRGYVTRKCTKNWTLDMDATFYSRIKERTLKTGYFHCQFSPYHMMKYGGASSLIGLEGIYPLHTMPSAKVSYEDYERFIAMLCNIPIDLNEPKKTHYFKKRPLLVRGARFLWFQTASFLGEPGIKRIDLIER